MNKILIIGNGFDLNLGLKTSYKEFVESNEFKNLIRNNDLARYLQSVQNNQNWVDIEHELKKYANYLLHSDMVYDSATSKFASLYLNDHYRPPTSIKSFAQSKISDARKQSEARSEKALIKPPALLVSPALMSNNEMVKDVQSVKESTKCDLGKFNQYFIKLKSALVNYLNTQTTLSAHDSDAFHLLAYGHLFNQDFRTIDERETRESVCSFTDIYSFNYTNTLGILSFDSSDFGTNTNIHFMHGSLKNNDIVFGVEDGSVDEQFLFLTKSSHSAFGKAPDIAVAMLAASEIHIFGCSLGDTDNAHFMHPFTELSQRRGNLRKTKIVFYVFGRTGYQNTLNRILALTNGHMSEFKITNDVIFFDLESRQVIDQQWINQL